MTADPSAGAASCDAERLARAFVAARQAAKSDSYAWSELFPGMQQAYIAAAQSLIDSGLVTVAPDPAEKIIREYSRRRKVNGFETVIESMLEDGTIAPGPNL